MSDPTVSINVTLDEAQKILDALAQQPYRDVYVLVNKVITQVQGQPAAQDDMPDMPVPANNGVDAQPKETKT